MSARHLVLLFLAAFFAACSQPATPTPTPPAATPLPPIASEPGGPVRAAGKVIPAEEADLAFPTAGQVRTVNVAVGDAVEAGEALVVLDGTSADAGVVEAQAALFRGQANLDELKAGPRTQEVAAAEGACGEAAQARARPALTPAGDSEIAAACASLAAAQAALQQLSAGPRQEERIAALADLANAEAVLKQAQSAYNQVKDRNDVGMLPQSRDLQQATNNHEAAQRAMICCLPGPRPMQ